MNYDVIMATARALYKVPDVILPDLESRSTWHAKLWFNFEEYVSLQEGTARNNRERLAMRHRDERFLDKIMQRLARDMDYLQMVRNADAEGKGRKVELPKDSDGL